MRNFDKRRIKNKYLYLKKGSGVSSKFKKKVEEETLTSFLKAHVTTLAKDQIFFFEN